MQVGLLSDTHGFLDEVILSYFENCDEVWHAGDFGPEVLDRLKAFKPVRGVSGNIDGVEIRSELPPDVDWQCELIRVYMTHDGGRPGSYKPRIKQELAERRPDLFICGHSHIACVMRDPELRLLHMNPGASGRIGWHEIRTMMRFSVDGRRVGNVELIELGRRHETKF
jgi:uncharacterized protein